MSISDNIKVRKVVIDSEKCISCGNCSVLAPEVFELDDHDSKCKLVAGASLDYNHLKQTAQTCPVRAIQLYDSNLKLINLD